MVTNVLGKISCDKLKQKLMDIEFILNDSLNKALITNRIKGVPSSNKIADFVSKYIESKQLNFPVVSKPLNADELINSLGEPSMDNEYIVRPDQNGKWWIEHKHVGSGEPLKQWLENRP